MKELLSPFFILLLAVSASWAQVDGSPKNWCRDGLFTRDSEEYGVASVIGKPNGRTYFFSDQSDSCPTGSNCATKAYVVTGDQLVVGRIFGNFACAWYTPKKGSPTVGWVESSRLRKLPFDRSPALSAWLGEWKYADNQITFTENKLSGYLNVTGDAVWKGFGDNVHIGELDGRFAPAKAALDYSDGDGLYDCKASMKLVGNFLIVADNIHCGGANVSFSGVYRLAKRY